MYRRDFLTGTGIGAAGLLPYVSTSNPTVLLGFYG
jgi:hypothetical protein